MPNLDKADRRDAKRHRARHGMKVGSRSVFTIQRLEFERAERIKAEEAKKGK